MSATCDTSVLVAALATWHPRHPEARAAVEERVDALPAHVILECYSVLTRLPAPHRLAADVAGSAVAGIDLPTLALPEDAHHRLVATLAAAGLTGGTVYDALASATARHHDRLLLTLDRRARATYDAVGVRFEAL